MTTFEIILTILMAIISLVATGAVPWAYMVGTRLARIESVITNGMRTEIAELKAFKSTMTDRVSALETASAVAQAITRP